MSLSIALVPGRASTSCSSPGQAVAVTSAVVETIWKNRERLRIKTDDIRSLYPEQNGDACMDFADPIADYNMLADVAMRSGG